VTAFGKDEDAESAVYRLSGKSEAIAEAGLAREGKNVQQGDAKKPFHPVEEPEKKISVRGRSAKSLQSLAASSSR